MKKLLVLIGFIYSFQIQSQCFEIQSILVDGCDGASEGKNEMVKFKVGALPLSVSTLTVNWPSNSWLGVCQSVSTATSVTLINSTILACGFLKEPVGGVLPANSKVLLVTSTDFNPLAQSFVNLSDTLIIIFQCAGNTAGHFANYSATPIPSNRTLQMSFSPTCTDVVTYNRNNLIKQDLTIGAQDGAAVEFDALGIETYVNRACAAPFIPLNVDAGPNKTLCSNSTQTLTATANGIFNTVNWSLGATASGSFSPTNSLTTTYTPGIGDNGTIKLYCSIHKICGTATLTAKDSVNITILKLPLPVISSNSITLCTGQTALLSYSLSNAGSTGTTSVLWSPGGATTNSLTINTATIYTIQVNNACGFNTTTFTISSGITPTVNITASGPSSFCVGSSVTFTAISNAPNYLWSNGSTSQILTVSTTQTAVVTTTNSCGISQASVTINVLPLPTLTLSANSVVICSGQSETVTATSNVTNYLWNTGEITNSIIVSTAGVKTVSVSNICGSTTGTINVVLKSTPTFTLSASSLTICPNETATLTAIGGTEPYIWSNSLSTGSTVTTTGGTVTVTNSNECGSITQTIVVSVININASISASPMNGIKPLVVDFTNNSTGGTAFLWDFGNGFSASTQTVSAQTYTIGGDFTVYLVVTNGLCTDIDSLIIKVLNEEPGLLIPNVFTPNGDGINEFFKITGYNITEFNCVIFNRWGLQLFEWSDIKVGWDGKIEDELATDGTYFYLINAKDINLKDIKKQGTFSLIR